MSDHSSPIRPFNSSDSIGCDMSRGQTKSENRTEPWTSETVAIGGAPTQINWAGRIADDNALARLKVQEPASPFVASIARDRRMQLINEQGVRFGMRPSLLHGL